MLKRLCLILFILLALIIILACEQRSELESNASEADNSSAGAEEDQHTDSKPDNDEIVSDEVINTQKDIQDEMVYFEEGGLSFSYPDFVGGEIRLETIAASDEDAFIVYPEHKMVSFNDYLLSGTMGSPQIQIFPLEEFLVLNDYNAEIIELTKLILTRDSIPEDIIEAPFVPQPMASQIFYANLNLIESQAGTGLRFITQYGQDVGPVTNDYIFYTYQGVTTDGRYYVSATFPVYHPELPSDFEDYFSSTGIDYREFEEGYTDYLDLTVQMLDKAEGDDFIPALGLLDNIMAGLVME